MSTGRSFRELDVHVGKVAHIREHPDLGLARLASDDRLKLAVDRELHIALVIRQRGIRRHIALGLAVRRGEVLQIAGNELEAARDDCGSKAVPAYQTVKYFVPGFDRLKLTGASNGR